MSTALEPLARALDPAYKLVLPGGLARRDPAPAAGEAAEFDTRTPHWFGAAHRHPRPKGGSG